MSSDLASTIITNVLVYGIYTACVLLAVMMAKMGVLIGRLESEGRIARREQEKADHIAALEANWPQYVIQEQP